MRVRPLEGRDLGPAGSLVGASLTVLRSRRQGRPAGDRRVPTARADNIIIQFLTFASYLNFYFSQLAELSDDILKRLLKGILFVFCFNK